MKALRIARLALLAACMTGACGALADAPADQVPDAVALLPAGTKVAPGVPLALVTFADRGLGRVVGSAPGEGYAGGQGYQSTAWGQRIAGELGRRYRLDVVTQWPIETLGVHCVVYAITDGRSLEAVSAALRADQAVSGVYPMQAFHTMVADPYRPLQRTVGDMRLDAAHRYATGRNVAVGVVDTAIDAAHADLAGQVERQRDLINDADSGPQDEAHGTAVAGVIAAHSGNADGIVGVAPDARLTALRACWPSAPDALDATCNTLTLAKAIDTAMRLKLKILNLSLTGPRDALLERLLETALASGMVVVGAEPREGAASAAFPTAVPGVIRVRVAGAGKDDAVLAAPGTDVFTTFPHGRYGYMSGSSIAAAHVSGVIALVLQLAPRLRADQLPAVLRSATDAPGLDACAAIARAVPGVDCAGTVIGGDHAADPTALSRFAGF